MWVRSELKDRAKRSLKTTYWKGFLVSLLLALVTGGLPGCSFNSGFNGSGTSRGGEVSWSRVSDSLDGAFFVILVIIIIVIIIAALLGLAFRLLLVNPLIAGGSKFFVQAAHEEANLNHVGYAFGKGRYAAIVKAMFWSSFLNFLWFLLLIVPGIVKRYAYSLVPYLLADNPNIGTKRAVQLSNRITRGHKWRMFVLDLSFIGWFLLGAIALMVGTLFVLPYYNAVKAELYLALREEALRDGLTTREELNLSEVV